MDMILKIKPEYKKFVVKTRSGSKYLIGKLLKGVYGTLLGAILFYNKLKDYLEKNDFEMNPYDLCTFNKMINGEQCTIQFHVDDLLISHKDTSVLNEIIDQLNNEFGKIKKLDPEYGPTLDYLGMQVDFSKPGTVKFTMFEYLEDILVECENRGWTHEAVTPAKKELFEIKENAKKLNNADSDFFHRITARLLYAGKRARPDIQLAVAFLCTRVSSPDEDDLEKLKRVIEYIRATIFIPLILGWDKTGSLVWSIDASFVEI